TGGIGCRTPRGGRCALRRVATPVARAVLEHDRRRYERSAPNHDRRTGARAPAGSARRSRRVVSRVGGPSRLKRARRTGSTKIPKADITCYAIRTEPFDIGHARAVLQHHASREAVLDKMIAAAKPGGWIVVSDVDWIQYDAQPVPEPFATLSRVLRDLSSSQ